MPSAENSPNRHVILCCSCLRQDKKALEVHAEMFPNAPVEVIKGRDRIAKFAEETKNPHIKAISKLGGRFAYLEILGFHNLILEEYNLITKGRLI